MQEIPGLIPAGERHGNPLQYSYLENPMGRGAWRATVLPLLLLSHFSRVRLSATPQMAAHQAPQSLGFSRHEHWSGLPFPSPMRENEVAQSCPTLSDPMDYSLPGSSVHGIFQARVLEWVAIAFSDLAVWHVVNNLKSQTFGD